MKYFYDTICGVLGYYMIGNVLYSLLNEISWYTSADVYYMVTQMHIKPV